MNTTIETETNVAAEVPKLKAKRAAAKKTKPAKPAGKAKKCRKPEADRANKKGEVIALLKRAKGAPLAEIMKATGRQPHTVRGFVSILGSRNDTTLN